ncbi:MAG: metallophosphoesterase [Myxococcales bacterium]|nr:metallophosphoesterase [Myxococcales bacterium]
MDLRAMELWPRGALIAGWLVVVVVAAIFRSRAYATMRGVLLGVQSLIVAGLYAQVPEPLQPVMLVLHGCSLLHAAALVRPAMRPLAYRLLVSWPDAFFQAGTLLAFPWAIAAAAGHPWPGWWAPYVLAGLGFVGTFRPREETIDLVVASEEDTGKLSRQPKGAAREEARPLTIVQITDPHLGPFMSVARLEAIVTRLVARSPDLILLTGDFLTMESQGDPAHLARALAPLKALPGRCYACFGNHDHEAPKTVRSALAAAGVKLLVDEAEVVETPAGPVQIVGADFRWRGVAEHLARLCERHPRIPGALRVIMLHAPSAFSQLPEGEGDLVLSGHTHGGQLGLLSLGAPLTFVSAFTSIPDHGFWADGTNRLYVHRGTGVYGFPLRVGVPAEESVLHVHRAA